MLFFTNKLITFNIFIHHTNYFTKNSLEGKDKLSSSSSKEPIPTKTFIIQFFDFLKTFGIIGLAIAFVIGQASAKLITALVEDIINPLVGLFLPSGSLQEVLNNYLQRLLVFLVQSLNSNMEILSVT